MKLTVENLSFGYRGHLVGQGVNFTLDAGEVLCLLGPNGAGKTTLFETILGLIAPLGGVVTADDASIDQWSRQRLAQLFGYVPQAQLGFFPFTVREVVLMGRTARIGAFRTPSSVLRTVYGVEVEITEIESGAGDKHLICLPSFARFRSTTMQRTV